MQLTLTKKPKNKPQHAIVFGGMAVPGKHNEGMTILEVVIAITILLIGAGFIMQSNAVSYRYRSDYEQRQQMLFYAAGQVEGLLEGRDLTSDNSLPEFQAQSLITPYTGNTHLEQVMVEVRPDSGGRPYPVKIYTYRLIP